MKEVLARPDHLKRWEAFARTGRRGMDWRTLLDGYVASVDWPLCNYYDELLAAFPDAKVILSVREADPWFDSFPLLVRVNDLFNRFAFLVPTFRRFRALTDGAVWHIFRDRRDRAACIAVFDRHIEEVKARVPPERLLVYRVQEGWAPLCAFLDRPVPDAPFPHVNSGAALKRSSRALIIRKLAGALLVVVALTAVLGIGLSLLMRF